MPLGTYASGAGTACPNPEGYSLNDALELYAVGGRQVLTSLGSSRRRVFSAASWLRANPHRLHLGQIGLHWLKADGSPARIEDLARPRQLLDLWPDCSAANSNSTGSRSRCAPYVTRRATCWRYALNRRSWPWGVWRSGWLFPMAATSGAMERIGGPRIATRRRLPSQAARPTSFAWWIQAVISSAPFVPSRKGFGPRAITSTRSRNRMVGRWRPFLPFRHRGRRLAAWVRCRLRGVRPALAQFWQGGGAIDLSACSDPRAGELERRIVLSQYLTAIQCAGSMPPPGNGAGL